MALQPPLESLLQDPFEFYTRLQASPLAARVKPGKLVLKNAWVGGAKEKAVLGRVANFDLEVPLHHAWKW